MAAIAVRSPTTMVGSNSTRPEARSIVHFPRSASLKACRAALSLSARSTLACLRVACSAVSVLVGTVPSSCAPVSSGLSVAVVSPDAGVKAVVDWSFWTWEVVQAWVMRRKMHAVASAYRASFAVGMAAMRMDIVVSVVMRGCAVSAPVGSCLLLQHVVHWGVVAGESPGGGS